MTSKALPEVRKARLPYVERSREMAWLAEHEQEYAGQWVVLWGDRLIGHADNPIPIMKQAREEGIDRPFMVHCRTWFGPVTAGWL